MKKNNSINFNPWLLSPQPEIDKLSSPDNIFSLGVPDDGLPAISDELRWVSRNNPRHPVQVMKTGISEWCPGTHIERKKTNELSIQFIVSGKSKLIVNGKEFSLQANDVFILHYDDHIVYSALSPERFRRQVVFLHHSMGSEIIRKTGLDKVSHVRFSPDKAKYFHEKLEYVDLINRSKQEGYIRDISNEVYNLILMLSDEVYGQIDSPVLPDSLIKAMTFVLNNLDLDLHCETIAKAAHCSAGHLTKLFKRYLNTSPHHWMEHQKIKQATILLQNSRKKVLEIAEELAYCNQFYFSKVFKQFMGVSPSKYRQLWRKKSGKK